MDRLAIGFVDEGKHQRFMANIAGKIISIARDLLLVNIVPRTTLFTKQNHIQAPDITGNIQYFAAKPSAIVSP
jgi:hypothetical protein